MSYNLPPNKLLNLIKGSWKEINYPALATIQAEYSPKDFFSPVDKDATRSCIPVEGKGFHLLFNSNIGNMVLKGETALPKLDLSFDINDGASIISFAGNKMTLQENISSEEQIDHLLTAAEIKIPSLLSLVTSIAIKCESLTISFGEICSARAETFVPQITYSLISEENRNVEVQKAIELIGRTRNSAKLLLSIQYLSEALFLNSNYYHHNPYSFSLHVILNCAKSIEILFGSRRDDIKDYCKQLNISEKVVESQIIPILLIRNELGSAHSSSFVPQGDESDLLRQFAQRSITTVQQLLLHICDLPPEKIDFLIGSAKRKKGKVELLKKVEEYLGQPEWRVDGKNDKRNVFFPDPRLKQESSENAKNSDLKPPPT